MSKVSFDHFRGKDGRMMWARKEEDYVADFHLVSRRALDPFHYQLFSFHYLLGADWRLCCRRLQIDKGQFFHSAYRVQETLGRIFYELEPYSLYPPRAYFATRIVGQPRSAPARPARRPAAGLGSWITGTGPGARTLLLTSPV